MAFESLSFRNKKGGEEEGKPTFGGSNGDNAPNFSNSSDADSIPKNGIITPEDKPAANPPEAPEIPETEVKSEDTPMSTGIDFSAANNLQEQEKAKEDSPIAEEFISPESQAIIKKLEEEAKLEAEENYIQKSAPTRASSAEETVIDTPNKQIGESEEHAPLMGENLIPPDEAPPMRIGDKLITMGLISDDQLGVALKEQKASQERKLIGQVLVDMGFITESAIGEVLAESAGTEKFDPATTVLDPELIRKVPKDIAQRQKAMAVGMEGNTVIMAMADVYNVLAIDQVRRYFDKDVKIKPVYCTETDIQELIEEYYDYETTIDGVLKEIETGISDKSTLDGQQEGYVNPTVRLVNAFLVDAIRKGASDIHFEPEGTFLRLRYRIDGQLVQIRSLHRDYYSAIAVRIKIMSQMNIAETRLPQDGRITYNIAGREVDFRVAVQPTIHGENIVMRLLDKKKALMPFDKLGFTDHNEQLLKKLLKRPEGIIIVTGPTGSGKTTTLYSVLEYINKVDVNIMTLEDPVEYQLSLIRQANVREGAGMGFADGMKSLMRQDPDIIFIGEIRDNVTANMAVKAAMTGHKVFSTLHTNDAIGIIPRLMDIGVNPELLSGSLSCGLAQRLARRLCVHCKTQYTATEDDCRILGTSPANPPVIHKAGKCDKCGNKGYKGRIALHEIMPIDKEMDELIATRATRNTMMAHLKDAGFISMADDAANKVREGIIDVPEMIRSVDVTDRL